MPYVKVNGFRMYYESHGEGPPVLYIHGGMGGSRSLVRFPWSAPERLVPGFRFVFYDRRGIGRSDAPELGYDLPAFAADGRALLDHLGIERAVVLGTSAGGPIGLRFALDLPERVLALVLANTSASLWSDVDAEDSLLVLELLRVVEAEGPEAAFRRRPEHARHSLEPFWRWPDAEARGRLDESTAEERELARQAAALPWDEQLRRHVAELRTCYAYMGVDLTPRLHEIACPVLLVHGEADMTVPFSESQEMARHLSNAELTAVPNAGHAILDHAEAQRAVAQFLRKIASEHAGDRVPT